MASFSAAHIMPPSARSRAVRKKAPEACERCREKRIKVEYHWMPQAPTGFPYSANTYLVSAMVFSLVTNVSRKRCNVSLPLRL